MMIKKRRFLNPVFELRSPVCMRHHSLGDNKPYPKEIKLECGCSLIRKERLDEEMLVPIKEARP